MNSRFISILAAFVVSLSDKLLTVTQEGQAEAWECFAILWMNKSGFLMPKQFPYRVYTGLCINSGLLWLLFYCITVRTITKGKMACQHSSLGADCFDIFTPLVSLFCSFWSQVPYVQFKTQRMHRTGMHHRGPVHITAKYLLILELNPVKFTQYGYERERQLAATRPARNR